MSKMQFYSKRQSSFFHFELIYKDGDIQSTTFDIHDLDETMCARARPYGPPKIGTMVQNRTNGTITIKIPFKVGGRYDEAVYMHSSVYDIHKPLIIETYIPIEEHANPFDRTTKEHFDWFDKQRAKIRGRMALIEQSTIDKIGSCIFFLHKCTK